MVLVFMMNCNKGYHANGGLIVGHQSFEDIYYQFTTVHRANVLHL